MRFNYRSRSASYSLSRPQAGFMLWREAALILEIPMKLDAAKRNALPASDFAEPAERKYPIEDKRHAGLAKGRAAQMHAKGLISTGQKAAIDAKANRTIGHTFHSIKVKK